MWHLPIRPRRPAQRRWQCMLPGLCLLMLSGCAMTPLSYQPDAADREPVREHPAAGLDALIRQAQLDNEAGRAPVADLVRPARTALPLSPGDRLRVLVTDGEPFSGMFEIDLDGNLHLPFLNPLPAAGRTAARVEQDLARALVEEQIFRPDFVQVSVKILQWAPVRVLVSGAVFAPGRILTNDRLVETRAYQITQQSGDYPTDRFLTSALRRAGGVRPDADITRVQLIRNGEHLTYDLSGVLSGAPFTDVPLVAGDRVVVPSAGYLQDALMRPSQVTPPGFDVFISNLTVPANSNAESAISKIARSMPYGTRLLRGLIAANCIGGIQSTNASRRAVLVTTDRRSGEILTRERAIDELIRNANHPGINPYLMPNDGIACYDSGATNAGDIAKLISVMLSPALILENLLD